MEIIGEITSIIYRNEVNSYTIAELETNEEITTVVGYLPFINVGDSLKLEGKFVEYKDYGRQFKVDTFEKIMPQTTEALKRYLANGNIKGIGEAIAKRIIDKFGEETIHVFRYEPSRLAEIRGISKEGAKEMSASFIENWEVWQIVGFLERFGIGAEYAKKVYDLLGINAIEQIESNPYILIDLAKGVDFKQIDKMALDLGVSYDNEKRVTSGIKYGLIRSTYNGNTCVIKENLIEFVINLLDVSTENIENGLIKLNNNKEIVIEKRENIEYIYLFNFYNTEEQIALRIKKLQNAKNVKKISNIEEFLEKIEKNSSIELSDKQKNALKMVNDNNVTIITGGPGTGKTTIIKNIIDIYEENGKIIGYAYANTFKDRAAYDWAVEMTIYMDKDSRHKGSGKKLYETLEKELKKQNITNLYACIGYPEVEDEYLTKNSVGYHEHLGYRFVGEFKKCGYKFNRWYNMVWMEKSLCDRPEHPEPMIWFSKLRKKAAKRQEPQ